jgi:hypothetical protein
MANVRWNLVIPEETDRSVRMLIARNGGRKGDLSRFVQDLVKQKIFEEEAAAAKAANADIPQEELQAMIDEAVDWARYGEGRFVDSGRS